MNPLNTYNLIILKNILNNKYILFDYSYKEE